MNSFRRRMMTNKDKYEYITDGLVLHLDGKWNGGVGKHLASTDIWVDLSPMGHNATTINGTKIAFGEDYSDQTSADAFIAYVGLPAAKDITFEVWFKSPITTSNRYIYINCWNYNENGTNRMTFSCCPDFFQYMGGGSLNTGVNFYPHGTITYNKTNQIFRFYNNGIEKITYAANLTDTRRTIPIVSIGKRWDTGFMVKLQLHSLRIYNRTLSEEEIKYNNALDNKRLGK